MIKFWNKGFVLTHFLIDCFVLMLVVFLILFLSVSKPVKIMATYVIDHVKEKT